ncbi:MAG TPA: DUF485 domain-containing protein [Pseudonocardiaceae bacterium]
MSTVEHPRTGGGPPSDAEWEEVQRSAEFVELRRRLRRFVFPMTAAFLAWYLLYVLMATYARGFMSEKLFGNITVGLVFGLLQFASTFLITGLYVRYADRRLDPLAAELRARLEGDDR